jgi:hypothetical protein
LKVGVPGVPLAPSVFAEARFGVGTGTLSVRTVALL